MKRAERIRTQFGRKLYLLLKARAITHLPTLATRVGCDITTVRRWFTDTEVERMKPDLLYRLSRALDVPMEIWFQHETDIQVMGGLSPEEADVIEFLRRTSKRDLIVELCRAANSRPRRYLTHQSKAHK